MAPSISFFADGNYIDHAAGSGLGFYGASFGQSVRVGEYQDRTFVTNGAGTSLGQESNNCKWVNSQSGILGSAGSGIALTAMPNQQASLEVRATFDSAVQVQSVRAIAYDRVSELSGPSGLVLKMAQLIHPDPVQNNNGSGSVTWTTSASSGIGLVLANSPGVSGLYAGNGTNSTRPDTTHSWFIQLSASPSSVGSKSQFGLFCSFEYL
jgi:hypothetical protein